jgi:hypothetical protein
MKRAARLKKKNEAELKTESKSIKEMSKNDPTSKEETGHGFFFFCKKYGMVFIVTYLVIEFGLLFLLFLAVSGGLMTSSNMDYVLRFAGHTAAIEVPDDGDLLRKQYIVLANITGLAKWCGGVEVLETWDPAWFHLGGSFVVAYISNKICEPPRMALSLVATPYVSRFVPSCNWCSNPSTSPAIPYLQMIFDILLRNCTAAISTGSPPTRLNQMKPNP